MKLQLRTLALHQAKQNHIKSEHSSTTKHASKPQVRPYSDVIYSTGDLVYYKRKGNFSWKGPTSIIGRDEQQ